LCSGRDHDPAPASHLSEKTRVTASLQDTIAAIATAAGEAGLAVIRISGPAAIEVASRVVRCARPLREAETHTLHHGWAWGAGAAGPLDEVVAAVFRAPRSFTGEDTAEISCHGGRLSAARVLDAVTAAGARRALPGEFSLRAFLHGRIDLSQAEAVADVISAGTVAAHRLALDQLAGALSRALGGIEESLADALAEVEARVDFAEDVGGVEVPEHVREAIAAAAATLGGLLAGAAFSRAVREGLHVPIVGRPNVGKSSLFNALLGEERAIVTPHPGTTRDRVSETIELAGVRVTLSDTAGLRATREPVEAIGVARAAEALAECAAAIWVVDASRPLEPADAEVAALLPGKDVVVALNKSDLPAVTGAGEVGALLGGGPAARWVTVSAATGEGLDDVRAAIAELPGDAAAHGAAVSNARHIEALGRARAALDRAAEWGRAGEPGEIVALEMREAMSALGEVTGRTADEDLLERIFGRFCVGK
jgi:tRNA modification GTPase